MYQLSGKIGSSISYIEQGNALDASQYNSIARGKWKSYNYSFVLPSLTLASCKTGYGARLDSYINSHLNMINCFLTFATKIARRLFEILIN